MSYQGAGKLKSIVVSAVISVLLLFRLGSHLRERKFEPFKPFLSVYLAPPDESDHKFMFRSGKMIVVNLKDKNFDDLYFQLPEKVAAATPVEVGVIAQLSWDRKQICQYTNDTGGIVPGYSQTCDVTLVDLKTKLVIDRKQFVGSHPPEILRGAESTIGERPDLAVTAYLKSLY